jgi:hypothetical protein
MRTLGCCLGAEKISGSNLRSARAKSKGRCNASSISDPASGDDRNADGIHDLRKQSHRTGLRGHRSVEIRSEESRAMSSRLASLSDQDVHAPSAIAAPRGWSRTTQPAAFTRASSGPMPRAIVFLAPFETPWFYGLFRPRGFRTVYKLR